MGQKVNPHGARVGVIMDWDSRWFAANKKDFADNIKQDYDLRKMLKARLYQAGISRIDIERSTGKVTVTLFTAKPGVVIGKGGAGVEALKKDIEAFVKQPVSLNIMEIKNPETDAQLVAESISQQLERRISFRRAMKQSLQRTMRAGAKGIKTQVSGRLGGADIARTEGYHEGSIPLQTLRANIDYGFAEAKTTYGRIGVKVWIYKGQILPKSKNNPELRANPERNNPPRGNNPARAEGGR